MSQRTAEAGERATAAAPAATLARAFAWLTSPAVMIALALLAVSLFAMPYYLRTTEKQLFEGELLMTLCGGFTRPIEERRQARPPLL